MNRGGRGRKEEEEEDAKEHKGRTDRNRPIGPNKNARVGPVHLYFLHV